MSDLELVEHYAGLAMQGLIAIYGCENDGTSPVLTEKQLTETAISYAYTLARMTRPDIK